MAMHTAVIDGRRVAYDDARPARPGSARPLLLVHGFTGGRDDWAGVLPTLAEDRRVVAVDLPGHGDSEGPDDEAAYTLGALAGWVLQAMDELELGDDVHLLGHSMGGLVVQRVAAAASQRLRSLVLFSTGLGACGEIAEDLARLAAAVRDDGLAAAWDKLQVELPERDAARAAGLRRRWLGMQPAAVVAGVRNLTTAVPLGAFLRGIDVPVLVLHGADDDRWTPADQRRLAGTVNGARYAVVADAQHSAQVENPTGWLEVVRPWLATIG